MYISIRLFIAKGRAHVQKCPIVFTESNNRFIIYLNVYQLNANVRESSKSANSDHDISDKSKDWRGVFYPRCTRL